MIAYRRCGDDMAGLVRYLLGPGRENEHSNPRVIATSEVISVGEGAELTDAERTELCDQLDWPTHMHGEEVAGGHVWHLSLTADPSDREITDSEWGEIVRRVMSEIGVDDPAKASARWTAINHGRNESGSQHVHVALNLVRDDGRQVSTWQDQTKLSHAVRDIEQAYSLTVIDARWNGTGTPAQVRGEIERAKREGRPEPDRSYLERVVRAASAISADESEFVRRVTRDGVLIRARMSDGGRWVAGYAVAIEREEATPIWYSGGNLKKDLSLPALRRHWTGTAADVDPRSTWAALGQRREYESLVGGSQRGDGQGSAGEVGLAEQKTVMATSPPVEPSERTTTSRRSQGLGAGGGQHGEHRPDTKQQERATAHMPAHVSAGPLPEDRQIAASEWDEARRQIAQAVAHLANVEPGDVATWALAARETAGVVSAWAQRVEPVPGPLARTAEQLSRSAQVPRGNPLHRPDDSPLRNLRGVAMVMAQASLRTNSVASWALLASQLMELVSQVEAAHRARDEMHSAERLVVEAHGELEKVSEQCSRATDLRDVVPQPVAAEVEVGPNFETQRPAKVSGAKRERSQREVQEAEEMKRRQAAEERRKAEEKRGR